MIVSLQWLRRFVPVPENLPLLEKTLTDIGLEVEAIETTGGDFTDVVVAEVRSCEKHPDAKKLSVCSVFDGEETWTVVCGAPNVATGQKVAFARLGCVLPAVGITIERRTIRGVESAGMICASDELGLGSDHSGILILPEDSPVGRSYRDLLGPCDTNLQIGITPNRGDALSHLGVARDLAAALRLPLTAPVPPALPPRAPVTITIEDPEGCPRYSAALLRGVRIQPSPLWLRAAVEGVGIRSINTVVDVTNYVMLELGQPLHAFDFSRIAGQGIVVRRSKDGETFTTLDGKTHTLTAGSVLICDTEKPVALAGVMGGQNSEITDETTDILLESAHFHPSRIRRTARQVGLSSESSYRFERGTDPERTILALERAVELILATSGGEVVGSVDAWPNPAPKEEITVTPDRVNALLGITIPAEEMERILRDLGFEVRRDGAVLRCIVPGWRSDCTRPIDLVEEIARIHGYDNIPSPHSITLPAQPRREDDAWTTKIRGIALGLGLDEVMSSSLVAREHHPREGMDSIVSVLNPVSQDRPTLRSHLLVSLLEAVDINLRNGTPSIAIFEAGKIYRRAKEGGFLEEEHFGIALTGQAEERTWHGAGRTWDFFDIKGFAEAILLKLGLDNRFAFSYDGSDSLFQHRLRILSQGLDLGVVGEVDPAFRGIFDVDQSVYACDLNLEAMKQLSKEEKRYQPVPKFPVVKRDLALVVEEGTRAEQLRAVIREAGCQYLVSVEVVDVFRHDSLGVGKKSLMVTCQFQSPERTLQEAEIQSDIVRILREADRHLQAVLRSSH